LFKLKRKNQLKTNNASETKPNSKNSVPAVPRIASYAAQQYAADYGQPKEEEIHCLTLHNLLRLAISG
jgi:hypothetical protein